ncbi:hypothetical protein [Lacipirellula sp.]|uniref:hypothetical protein n=1 Tax=Lacipirellula sp. TaxID=2691419 RepID=UPI003D0EE061
MSVGRLSVTCAADIGEFRNGIAEMRNSLQTLPPAIDRANDRVSIMPSKLASMATSALAAAASIATVTAVAHGIGAAMERLDRLNDKSSQIGIDPAQLARLGYAAKMNGAEFETMNAALAQMNRRVSEAAVGTGKAAGALSYLGINATELNGLAVEDKFSTIADRISMIENPADQARVAFKLFGNQGLELVETLRLGGDGIAKFMKEADRFGIVVGKEDLERIGQAKDAIDKLGLMAEGAFNRMAVAFAPAITEGINNLIQLNESPLFQSIVKSTGPMGFITMKMREYSEESLKAADAQRELHDAKEKAAKLDLEALQRAEKLSEEYEKQVAELQRQAKVARFGETNVKYWEDVGKFGQVRANQLAAERRDLAAAQAEEKRRKDAESNAEQARKEKVREVERKRQEEERKHADNMRKDAEAMEKLRLRIRDYGKTGIAKDRDELLRTLEDPSQRAEAEKHFATLKRLQTGDDRLKALQEDRKTVEGRSGKDKFLDARTVEGWAQLRRGAEDPQLARLDQQIEEQRETNRLLRDRERGSVLNF